MRDRNMVLMIPISMNGSCSNRRTRSDWKILNPLSLLRSNWVQKYVPSQTPISINVEHMYFNIRLLCLRLSVGRRCREHTLHRVVEAGDEMSLRVDPVSAAAAVGPAAGTSPTETHTVGAAAVDWAAAPGPTHTHTQTHTHRHTHTDTHTHTHTHSSGCGIMQHQFHIVTGAWKEMILFWATTSQHRSFDSRGMFLSGWHGKRFALVVKEAVSFFSYITESYTSLPQLKNMKRSVELFTA